MLFLEIFLSIHSLLFLSSYLIGGPWLVNQPSFKLQLARLLLVSCVLSPLIVHCLNMGHKPEGPQYSSFDAIQEYANQPILKHESVPVPIESTSALTVSDMSYFQLFLGLFCLLIAYRSYKVLMSLNRLRTMLNEAISYRGAGKLLIKVSHRCHIPFSILLFNKAYIVLPISLLSSPKNVKIAIAHEGQHHRNGDCFWAYIMEALRIFFVGNPGITRWSRIVSELQEFSCDEVLVGQPSISAHDYGHCLFDVVQTVSQCSMSANREIACTVGMALGNPNEDCTLIIRRITMLSNYPHHPAKSWFLGMAVSGASILAPMCVAYSAVGAIANTSSKEINTAHLNPRLQRIAEKEIRSAVQQYHAKSGVVAIADPATGHILAFAESGKITPQTSWKSRVFSPGSTIKPFIAAAAIDSGKISEKKRYDCHSPYTIEGQSFTNYNPKEGTATLTEAIAKSINVCLIKVSQDTGSSIIRNKLSEFGFDMNSWWQTSQSDELQLAKVSLGDNVPATIDSLTKSYVILANQGRQLDSQVISLKTAKSIQGMLETAVLHGTGKLAVIPGVAVAGKTGTVVDKQNKQLALFAGYLPANSPQYVMLVVIEDGHLNKNGEVLTSGGELAAPVFRNIAKNSLKQSS